MMTPSALLQAAAVLPADVISAATFTLGQFSGPGNQGNAGSQGNQSGSVSLQQGLDIIVGLGWLIAAVVLLIVAAVVLRKWLLRDDASSASLQFTMADLRQMRDEGLMTPEEFDRAKKFLVSRGKAMLVESEEKDQSKQAGASKPVNKAQEPDIQKDESEESSDEPR